MCFINWNKKVTSALHVYILITLVSYHFKLVNLDQTRRKTKMDLASTFISDNYSNIPRLKSKFIG